MCCKRTNLWGRRAGETNQPPQLRVELFGTLAAIIGSATITTSYADFQAVETVMRLVDEAKYCDPSGMPKEIDIEERNRKYPILRSFLDVSSAAALQLRSVLWRARFAAAMPHAACLRAIQILGG